MKFPEGIYTISRATALRWAGWGLVEALIPIFLYQFTGNYVETALLTGAFHIFFLLTLPIAGVLADRISAKGMLLTALSFYLLVGLGYFTAGMTGMLVAVILARAFNGIAYSLDIVARVTYFRRHVAKEHISKALGHMIAVGNFWWLAMLALSMLLVNKVPLKFLFLAIAITSLGGIVYLALRLRRDREHQSIRGMHIIAAYRETYLQMHRRGVGIYTLMFLGFTISLLASMNGFFMPLYVYAKTESLIAVTLVTGLITLPSLFSRQLGAAVDRVHQLAVWFSISLIIVLLASFPFAPFYGQLALAFGIALCVQVLSLSLWNIVTHRVKPERYGRAESLMQVANNAGTICGAVLLGISTQQAGVENAPALLATFAVIALMILFARRRFLSITVQKPNKASRRLAKR